MEHTRPIWVAKGCATSVAAKRGVSATAEYSTIGKLFVVGGPSVFGKLQ